MPRRLFVCAIFAVGTRSVSTVAAEPPTVSTPTRSSSAFQGIADDLSTHLGAARAAAVAAALPRAEGLTAPEAGRLARRLVEVVAQTLGAAPLPSPVPLGQAEIAARARGVLVYLEAEILHGELRVSASAHGTRGFWARVKAPEAPPLATAFASRRVDAEVSRFFPPVPLVVGHVERATGAPRDTLALACGDLDDDGSLEIVVVNRGRIDLGRVRDGRFVAETSKRWVDLSPVAAAPMREPIGAARVEAGVVDVGLSDRSRALSLDARLAPRAKLDMGVPWLSAALGAAARDVGLGDVALDAASSALHVDADGAARRVFVGRAEGAQKAFVVDDRGHRVVLEGSGAQLAVADLDRDGAPEILGSLDTLAESADALVVRTWRADGALVERLRIPVPDGIAAVAACPAEDGGLSPAIVATRTGELWVIR